MDIRNQMTRPDINGSDQDNDWQGTLLDRSMQPRRRAPVSSYEPQPKNRLWIAAVAFAVVALVIVVTMMVKGGGSDGNAPMIKADVTPYKTRPDQPGGTAVPFQDKLVFNRLDPNGQPVQAEKLLPPPEEPLANKDMTTKQVTAPPAPGNTVAAVTPTAVSPQPALVVKPAAPEPIVEKPAVVAEAPTPQAAPVATVQNTEPVVMHAPTPAPAPVAKVVETPKPVATAPTPVAKPVVAAAPTPVTGGQVRIQLASIPEAGNAQKALADLSGKYRSALGGTSLGIVKADLGAKGTYYRIQSGGLSRDSAERVCASVKAQGGACIIAH